MGIAWTIKESDGHLRSDLVSPSRLDVGRKVVPAHYDAFRLQVSSSYREQFDRALSRLLAREGWEIVCLAEPTSPTRDER
jgi:hypothetical protein